MTAGAPREDRRRALHLASGTIGIAALFPSMHAVISILLPSLLALAVAAELLRRASPAFERLVERLAQGAMRPVETRAPTGSTLMLAGYALAWWLFPAHAAASGMLVTSFADPAASFVGIRAARARGRKTIAGSAAAFIVALVVLLVTASPIGAALAGALAGTVAERLPGNGLDNVAMPLATAAAVWLTA